MTLLRLLLAGLLFLVVAGASGLVSQAAPVALVPLPEQEVREAVERFLTEKFAGRGWEVAIRQLSQPHGVKISKGERSLELVVPAGWEGLGPVSIALVVRVNGVVEKNLPLRLQIDVKVEMVTAVRQLPAGTVLAAEDLQLQKQELSRAGGQPIKNISDAVGKKTRISLNAGTPVRSNQLASVPVIVSGQMVTIVAENAGVRITVSGRARSAGGVGDLIRVQNTVSNKEISARIVDASTVEIGF